MGWMEQDARWQDRTSSYDRRGRRWTCSRDRATISRPSKRRHASSPFFDHSHSPRSAITFPVRSDSLSLSFYIYIPCCSVIHHSTRLGRVFVSSFLFFFFLSSFLSFFTFYEKRRGERGAVISSRIADFDEVARGL